MTAHLILYKWLTNKDAIKLKNKIAQKHIEESLSYVHLMIWLSFHFKWKVNENIMIYIDLHSSSTWCWSKHVSVKYHEGWMIGEVITYIQLLLYLISTSLTLGWHESFHRLKYIWNKRLIKYENNNLRKMT